MTIDLPCTYIVSIRSNTRICQAICHTVNCGTDRSVHCMIALLMICCILDPCSVQVSCYYSLDCNSLRTLVVLKPSMVIDDVASFRCSCLHVTRIPWNHTHMQDLYPLTPDEPRVFSRCFISGAIPRANLLCNHHFLLSWIRLVVVRCSMAHQVLDNIL